MSDTTDHAAYSDCSVKPRSHCIWRPTLTHARGHTAVIADRLLERTHVHAPPPPLSGGIIKEQLRQWRAHCFIHAAWSGSKV